MLLLLAAVAQLFLFVQRQDISGSWFLFGTDTIFHDAVVHLRIQQELRESPLTIPLWMAEIQGGIPTVGAFLWTPLAPNVWPLYVLEYPTAQKLGWLMALWIAGFGGYAAARALRLHWLPALAAGMTWMLCGHLVTLIHAGHFQKVMALSWLGWAFAGAVIASRPAGGAHRTAGAALAAFGIAMTLLSGHPQIAYLALVMVIGWGGWQLLTRRSVRRKWGSHVAAFAAIPVLGLMTAGAQLLPGTEMSALSNRAGGVAFGEAVETSYPPGELLEFVIPRVKGSSVFGDTYRGEWGDERIVSDYFGLPGLVLALLALGIGRARRPMVGFLLVAVVLSLWIGLGSYTPLYRLLYDWIPGFDSFRSPGTFMAGTSFALAMLAGFGAQAAICFAKSRNILRVGQRGLAAVLLLHVLFVGVANRHFLHAWEWQRYQREFLAPTMLDLWLAEGERRLETHDAASELSLRPILFGGRAINGYHPIYYQAKERRDGELSWLSPEWFAAWGVRYLMFPPDTAVPDDFHLEGVFPDARRMVARLPQEEGFVAWEPADAIVDTRWGPRRANVRELEVNVAQGPVTLEVREIAGPDSYLYKNSTLHQHIEEPLLASRVALEEGNHMLRWEYRPRSWSVGVFFTALGMAVLGFLGTLRIRTSRSSPY